MSAVLNSAYARLNASQQVAYRRLGLMLDPTNRIDIAAAAAALEVGHDEAHTALCALRDAHLVYESATGQWHMDSQTAQHARGLALRTDSRDERQAARARTIRSYLVWAAAADKRLSPHQRQIAPVYLWPAPHPFDQATRTQTLDHLQQVLDEILEAQTLAARSSAESGLRPMAWQFSETLRGYLLARHPYRRWEQICQVGLDAAQRCGDLAAQARVHDLAGVRARVLGRDNDARRHYAQARHLARHIGDRHEEAAALEQLAAVELKHSNADAAVKLLERGLRIHATAPLDPHGEALLRRRIGLAQCALGDPNEARSELNEALHVFTELHDPISIGRVITDLAQIELGLENAREALDLLQQALERFSDGSPLNSAHAHFLQAVAHERTGSTQQAKHAVAQALKLYHGLDMPHKHPFVVRVMRLAAQLNGGPSSVEPET